jgi:uncharacterized protein YciI
MSKLRLPQFYDVLSLTQLPGRRTMHYLLFYDVVEDYIARRAAFRDAHLSRAWAAAERGELVLAGALADPVDGAVLLFRGSSPSVAESFARADPYVTAGLVTRWRVREWTTVAGDEAATPVKSSLSETRKK